MLTKDILKKSGINQKWYEVLSKSFDEYNICKSDNKEENINELAMFLAQCGHESINFTKLEENLNYSANTLLKIFPKYFKDIEEAKEVVSKGKESIANRIYGGRLGNAKNEGYKYRGRGIIQLTGKNNYKKYGEKLGINLVDNPDLASSELIASNIACCYWIERGLQPFARKGNVKTVTKMINGGYNGLEDREKRFKNILKILEAVND
ncbi:glycoside hydrolase family 19 protein [Brachyspira murdochii]|uniref:glycoside hydrolase family 19 protein n=1 Tax=Brachyspira murdochii TaxID=84378 RepID=UPI0030055694